MCYLIVYTIFDFPDDSTLKTPANGAWFLAQLTTRTSFRVTGEGYESPEAAWSAAIRWGQRAVNLAVINEQMLELTFSIVTNNWRRLYVAAERNMLSNPVHVEALLSVDAILYETLHPDYGFGLVAMDSQPLPSPGEGDYAVTTLYDFNFYSPRLVQRLGETALKSVAAWRIGSFADGGFFLGIVPNPLADKKSQEAAYKAAIATLGLAQYQQAC
jgi:hypothetical protein